MFHLLKYVSKGCDILVGYRDLEFLGGTMKGRKDGGEGTPNNIVEGGVATPHRFHPKGSEALRPIGMEFD